LDKYSYTCKQDVYFILINYEKFIIKSPNSYLACSKCRKQAFRVNFYRKNDDTTTLAICLECGEAVYLNRISGVPEYVEK
jgi:hypothetical protein